MCLQAYPEYARQILDKVDVEFNDAVSSWGQKYNQVNVLKYVKWIQLYVTLPHFYARRPQEPSPET